MIKAQTSVADTEKIESINLKLKETTDGKFKITRNRGHEWNVKASEFAKKTTNPIRAIVEHLNVQPNPEKSFIPLSVGKSYAFYIASSLLYPLPPTTSSDPIISSIQNQKHDENILNLLPSS